MLNIVCAIIAGILPLLWLLYMVAYNTGRDAGVRAERERWTRAFQGKGNPDKLD